MTISRTMIIENIIKGKYFIAVPYNNQMYLYKENLLSSIPRFLGHFDEKQWMEHFCLGRVANDEFTVEKFNQIDQFAAEQAAKLREEDNIKELSIENTGAKQAFFEKQSIIITPAEINVAPTEQENAFAIMAKM